MLACFFSFHISQGKINSIWLLSCEVLHYVHQLIANFVPSLVLER